MIRFEIPDSPTNREINLKLINIMKRIPELFYENVEIEAVFGCPSHCIWNGGCSQVPVEEITNQTISRMFNQYEMLGIPYRLTFSNMLVQDCHLSDEFGNFIAKEGNRNGNAVIVSSDTIQKYIENHYSNYRIIQSISRSLNDLDAINKSLEEYLTCLPLWINHDFEKLQEVNNITNAILLVNECCPINNCQYSYQHYKAISNENLYKGATHYSCQHSQLISNMAKENKLPPHNITHEEYIKYENIGIKHFKLAGRTATKEQIIDLYCSYFAKPNKKDDVKRILQNA